MKMLATVLLLFFVPNCHAWLLESTQLQVHDHRNENVTLTCRHINTNDSTQPRMKEVTRIYIRKSNKDPHDQWPVYAKVYNNHQPAIVVHPLDDGVTPHGHAGPVADSYLSITWKMSSKDTVGTYVCQVDGYTELDTPTHVTTPPVSLVMAPHKWKDALDMVLEYERQANDLQKKWNEIHSQGVSILKYYATQKDCTSQFQWPGGSFALIKPDSGCPHPRSTGEKWLDGYVRFNTESSSGKYPNDDSVSNPSHMAGPVLKREGGQNLLYMRTCRHEENRTSPVALAWPRGKYCVLQVGQNQPDDFRTGTVTFDLEDQYPLLSKEVNGPKVGLLPGNIRLFFWCVDDGDPSTPIDLPVESPFYLFRRGGRCQEVRNANVTEESFTVDTEDTNGNDDLATGIHPDVTLDPVQLHTCYYQPNI